MKLQNSFDLLFLDFVSPSKTFNNLPGTRVIAKPFRDPIFSKDTNVQLHLFSTTTMEIFSLRHPKISYRLSGGPKMVNGWEPLMGTREPSGI